jgi:hypothetical protein
MSTGVKNSGKDSVPVFLSSLFYRRLWRLAGSVDDAIQLLINVFFLCAD